ncbi:MAG: hypothetical protein K0R80_1632 [Clostridia bacterium]|jgi:hypothetical protein|nr:hypothetical protein [Clostridia bacterium]
MFRLDNEKSVNYQMITTIIILISVLSLILTQMLDDTKYEFIFRGLWVLTASLWGIANGTKEIFIRRNKAGYLYYLGVFIFLLVILYIRFFIN